MTSEDFTPVWKALNTSHVLLLVDIPAHPQGGYDPVAFEARVDTIYNWFSSVVKERLGLTDMRMANDALLFIRPLISAPNMPKQTNLRIMVLR